MATNRYVIFNKQGRRLRTIEIEAGIEGINNLETELKEKGQYAHRIESFSDRPYWNGWTFKEKLQNLGWEFDENGLITNADW